MADEFTEDELLALDALVNFEFYHRQNLAAVVPVVDAAAPAVVNDVDDVAAAAEQEEAVKTCVEDLLDLVECLPGLLGDFEVPQESVPDEDTQLIQSIILLELENGSEEPAVKEE